MRSIAFQIINSEKRGYPPENGAHIAIRTVRRFLERFGSSIDLVIFCMDRDEDIGILGLLLLLLLLLLLSSSLLALFTCDTPVLYSSVLPLYFPRSTEEEAHVLSLLPEDTGNENGETVIEERKIRIAATPVAPVGTSPKRVILSTYYSPAFAFS